MRRGQCFPHGGPSFSGAEKEGRRKRHPPGRKRPWDFFGLSGGGGFCPCLPTVLRDSKSLLPQNRRNGARPDAPCFSFCCRTALFRKRQGAAAKEEGRVSGRATFLCFRGNKALHLRAVSPEANLIPRPRKVRKSPTVFFGPGDVFFFVLLFLRQKKKDPRAGSTPRRGRGTSPRRPQTAYPAFSPRGVKIPQDAKASCGRRSLV